MHANGVRVIEAMANFTTGDEGALSKVFADDAVWIFGGRSPFAGRYEGKRNILKWLREIRSEVAIEVRPIAVLASDKHVVFFNEVIAGHGAQRVRTREACCCVMNDLGEVEKFFQVNADQDVFDACMNGNRDVPGATRVRSTTLRMRKEGGERLRSGAYTRPVGTDE
jgi:hypothetical protein